MAAVGTFGLEMLEDAFDLISICQTLVKKSNSTLVNQPDDIQRGC